MIKIWGKNKKVEVLPTLDCEAGYDPGFSHSVVDDKRNYTEKKCDGIERGRYDWKTTSGFVKELTNMWVPSILL